MKNAPISNYARWHAEVASQCLLLGVSLPTGDELWRSWINGITPAAVANAGLKR